MYKASSKQNVCKFISTSQNSSLHVISVFCVEYFLSESNLYLSFYYYQGTINEISFQDIPVVMPSDVVEVNGRSVVSGLGDRQFRLRMKCVTPGE